MCIGGGFEIALMPDIVVASEKRLVGNPKLWK
jgi:enoyl-CoA hydratase/carnithine racemase